MLRWWLRVLVSAWGLLSWGLADARNLPEFTALVKQNGPAVVNISTKQTFSLRNRLPDGAGPPESDALFDELMQRLLEQGGQDGSNPFSFDFDSDSRGSGFIYSQDGYIVTNRHVVESASEISVKLNDGRELPAKVVGSDERTDIALLKVAAERLPELKLGTSQHLQVGEWVLAIGSPFGFDHSATAGIVSAMGRSLPDANYVPFIQTDVAINPGNSGGPLFNLAGEVVGINSQIYSRSGGFMGVSFAIPIDVARGVIEQLKTSGSVSRGWIGVYVQEISASLAESFNMAKPEGALVAQVVMTGPAAQVLTQGDVILTFAGKPVADASALPPLVAESPLGKPVQLEILREGKRQTVSLTIAELPTEGSAMPDSHETASQSAPVAGILGMHVSALDAATREALELNSDGIRVEAVIGEPARKTGLVAGDVITQIDGQAVASPEQLQTLAAGLKAGKTVAVLVQRDGSARFLAMKIEANATE